MKLVEAKTEDELGSFLISLSRAQLSPLAMLLEQLLSDTEIMPLSLKAFRPTKLILWTEKDIEELGQELTSFLKGQANGKVLRIEQ